MARLQAKGADGRPIEPGGSPIDRALRGETVTGFVLVFQRPDGRAMWTSCSASPIYPPDGELLGAVAVFADVTELHELQEQREDFLRRPEARVSGRTSSDCLEVAVRDRGVGIPAEDCAHVFERYYRAKGTRKAEGLGPGLYIARMLVGAMGGRIWVESSPGSGSTFTFTLPKAA